MKPWRAAETRATASGKSTRMASSGSPPNGKEAAAFHPRKATSRAAHRARMHVGDRGPEGVVGRLRVAVCPEEARLPGREAGLVHEQEVEEGPDPRLAVREAHGLREQLGLPVAGLRVVLAPVVGKRLVPGHGA